MSPVYHLTPTVKNSTDPYVPNPVNVSRHSVFRLQAPAHRKKALVIGVGGGMDVFAAYQAGFSHIDAVDINPVPIGWLKGPYSDWLLGLFNDPRVHLYNTDGRNFVARANDRYDALLIYNVDSLTGATSGAYNLLENYLFTSEAVADYFRALSEEGILQISRPIWGGRAEIQRLFNTISLKLIQEGKSVGEHLAVFENADQVDFLVGRKRLTGFALENLLKFYRHYGVKDARIIFSGFVENEKSDLHQLLSYAKNGRIEEMYERAIPNDIRPVSDGRPYFFETKRLDRLLFSPSSLVVNSRFNNWSGFILSLALVLSSVTVLLLLILTLIKTGSDVPLSLTSFAFAYFAAIGCGYMAIQMVMMQRFALVLGHPILSMTLTIPTLLMAMGFSSSFISPLISRWAWLKAVLLTLIPIVLGIYVLKIPQWIPLLVPQTLWIRVGGSVCLLLPLGIFLGLAFPIGLHLFSFEPKITPMAWAANGGASVLGSLGAMLCSMALGFDATMTIALCCYILSMAFGFGVMALAKQQFEILTPDTASKAA